jgi:hypothetical protein
LIGAKRFCVRCGREQKGAAKKAAAGSSKKKARKETDKLECHKCGELTERTCYFCGKPTCQPHLKKMQANALPSIEFNTATSLGDHKRVNAGWRGFIISACSRCTSINHGKPLNEDELIEIRTVDKCTWYDLSTAQRR